MPRTASRARDLTWVTKTDLIRFMRCPWTFWQLSIGAISPSDLTDDVGAVLIADGRAFEAAVVRSAAPATTDADLPQLLAGDATIVTIPTLEHPGLRLRGAPDGIVAAHGAAIPVEIKSHKALRRSDEIELAFYWLLLQPQRTREIDAPHGWVILRQDGQPREVRVPITPELLADVTALIAQVRDCRRDGARPRVCGCVVCSGPRRELVERLARDAGDLTLINGVGRHYARLLEEHEIADCAALLTADPGELSISVRRSGRSMSPSRIRLWQRHADSYRLDKIVFFGQPLAVDELIALDLEYEPVSGRIWLAGLHVIRGDDRVEHVLWADTEQQETDLLAEIARVAAEHPDLPIVTWGGNEADVPMLRRAAARLGRSDVLADVLDRHIDALQHARRSWRVPIPRLAMSALTDYFQVPVTSAISDGLEAQMLYTRYLRTTDTAARERVRRDLIAYNRDDLLATAAVLQAVAQLASEG